MGDQRAEIESAFLARFGPPERLAVEIDRQHPVEPPARPGRAQFIGRGENRREVAGRLRLDKAEALGQLVRDEIAQRDIVDQPDQTDVIERLGRRDALRHVAGDHADLCLHVAAPGLVSQLDWRTGGAQVVAAALVHQRIVPEALRQLRPARLADQFDVVDVSRTIGPLIGPRQRRGDFAFVEPLARDRAVFQLGRQCAQHRLVSVPVVQRGLQRGHQVIGRAEPGQVAGNDHQPPVAAMGKRGKLHPVILLGPRPGCKAVPEPP